MIDCRFKPLVQWPGKATAAHARKSSRFKAGWQDTLKLLERELNHLRAKEITIEGYFRSQDIRNDGWPKSSARPEKPGVILSFETKQGRMAMPCDLFTDWEANLRAIALTLEHLRAAARYGVTTDKHEQYTGWLKLPTASESVALPRLAKILTDYSCLAWRPDEVLSVREVFETVWREAVRRTHPDKNPGRTHVDFNSVIEARDHIKRLKQWE